MRCKNCGLENDDNLYICQNCGSPLYDEADLSDDDSTVEFKKISGNDDTEISNSSDNDNDSKNDKVNNEEDKKKKQLTITIIVLCVVLVAVIAGIIGAALANNKSDDDLSTSDATSTTIETTTKPSTTKPTTEIPTNAPIAQYMVTVRASKGGTVDGGGQFEKGRQIKITATPSNGYNFVGWYTPNGVKVTQSLSHTFTLTEDVIYEAKFEKIEVPTTTTTTTKSNAETTTKLNDKPVDKDVNNG